MTKGLDEMGKSGKTYVITVINTTNIILTTILIGIAYAVNNYMLKGFIPSWGYLALGYGLGFFLPPYLSYKLPMSNISYKENESGVN